MGNAVTSRVTNGVGNAARNAAPDPTRPDPTQKTLMVAAGRQAQTATREPAVVAIPVIVCPPWFKPPASRVRPVLSLRRSCTDCGVRWNGPDSCWCCGQPGESWWSLP